MKRNNGYIEFSFNSSYDELVSKRVISLIDRNKTSFYLEEENMFFKEEDNAYLELVGSKIANYLGIRCVNYDLVEINFTDKNIKGVISKDFREKDKKLVNFDLIINDYIKEYFYKDIDNPMNLEFMCNALNYRYRNYNDVRLIVDNIMDELITYFLLDILIGNYDNGRYNYEIMENESDAKNTPYYDFGHTFKFKNTRFTVSDSGNYDVYDNLLEFLRKLDIVYINKFIDMYNMMTPNKLEEIFLEIESDIGIRLPDNFKNILFLSYSRHYEKINKVLVDGRVFNSLKK